MHTTTPIPSRPARERSRRGRLVPLLVLVLLAGGCRAITRNPYDKIEAELRTRERELAEARAELRDSKLLNEAYGRTPRGLPCNDPGTAPFLPIKEIVLGSGTGGVDNDNLPGDESLQVVIVPRDGDNSAVKVPANVTVLAFDVAKNGTKTAIGRWDVAPERLGKTWKGGLFATGYYLALQWDRPPSYDRVKLVVQLQTLDGRTFEAEREVSVRVLSNAGREQYLPLPMVPGSTEPLPPPALVPSVPPKPTIDELPPPTEVRRHRPASLEPARSK